MPYDDISRILVMRPGALGDVIVTLPLLSALRRQYPDSSIELMARSSYAEWLKAQGIVDAAWSIDISDVSALFMPADAVMPAAGEFFSQFQLAVSLWKRGDDSIIRALRRYMPHAVAIDPLPDERVRCHTAEQILSRAVFDNLLAPPTPECALQAMLPLEQPLRAARELLAPARAPRVAIHPGSGGKTKNWPPQRFAGVARELHRRGLSIVLIEGPADRDAAQAFRHHAGGLPFAEMSDTALPVLAAGLSMCGQIIGNDSGVPHLAAAMGVPSVVVFGPSDPCHWRPLHPETRVIRAEDHTVGSVTMEIVLEASRALLP